MELKLLIEQAIDHTNKKLAQGKLIKPSDDFEWMDEKNYIGGDPETIYSIASLYSNNEENADEVCDAIEAKLIELFPQYK